VASISVRRETVSDTDRGLNLVTMSFSSRVRSVSNKGEILLSRGKAPYGEPQFQKSVNSMVSKKAVVWTMTANPRVEALTVYAKSETLAWATQTMPEVHQRDRVVIVNSFRCTYPRPA
jgi:hypothetical protein